VRAVFSTCVEKVNAILSAPNDHLAIGPHCSVSEPCGWSVDGAGGCPAVRAGIVSAAGVETVGVIPSAPNNHFTAGPTAVCESRPPGALLVLVGVQLSVSGLYLPPVLNSPGNPPQTIISLPSTLPCEAVAQQARSRRL